MMYVPTCIFGFVQPLWIAVADVYMAGTTPSMVHRRRHLPTARERTLKLGEPLLALILANEGCRVSRMIFVASPFWFGAFAQRRVEKTNVVLGKLRARVPMRRHSNVGALIKSRRRVAKDPARAK